MCMSTSASYTRKKPEQTKKSNASLIPFSSRYGTSSHARICPRGSPNFVKSLTNEPSFIRKITSQDFVHSGESCGYDRNSVALRILTRRTSRRRVSMIGQ